MTGPLILKDNPAEDLEAATKQYVDNHTSDTVLYTQQTLTDEQKTQARGNIGAAPDGFGLGKSAYSLRQVSPADIDTCTTAGWYYYYDSAYGSLAGLAFSGGIFVIPSFTDTLQYFFPRRASPNPGTYAVRKLAGDTWTEWDISNPPLELGVEYRTTEQYLGKPVYTKVVDCGYMANGKTVEIVSHAYRLIDCRLKGNPQMFPMLPESDTTLSEWSGGFVCGGESITLCAGPRLAASNHPVKAIVKYIDA